MYITHKCLECGYSGEIKVIMRTVTCPNCKTVNDVWLEGEQPPLNHIYKEYLYNIEQRYGKIGLFG